MKQRRFQLSNLGISRGAMVVLGLEVGFSLIWLLSNLEARATLLSGLASSLIAAGLPNTR